MSQLKRFLLVGIIVCHILAGNGVAQEPAPKVTADAAWQTVNSIVQLSLDEHFLPVVSQQLYMSSTRAVYQFNQVDSGIDFSDVFSGFSQEAEFEKEFTKAWNVVSASKGFDGAETLNHCVKSLMVATGSKTTSFVSAKTFQIANSLKENQYVGIGIQLTDRDGVPMITKPFYGGAAQKAGARPNDLIVEVNGVATKGRSLGEVVEDLRGPKGSKLTVTLRNVADSESREYEMVRTTIPIPSIEGVQMRDDGSWNFDVGKGGKVGYLNFTSIVGSTAAELRPMARELSQQGFGEVILDFRGVGQCDIHHVVMLADVLFDEIELGSVHYQRNSQMMVTRPGALFDPEIKLAVLADRVADGPLFLLLSNLKNRDNTVFVGNNVHTSGIATKSLELPNGLGAVNNFPWAVCKPLKVNSEIENVNEFLLDADSRQIRYRIDSDKPAKQQGVALINIAINALTENS